MSHMISSSKGKREEGSQGLQCKGPMTCFPTHEEALLQVFHSGELYPNIEGHTVLGTDRYTGTEVAGSSTLNNHIT